MKIEGLTTTVLNSGDSSIGDKVNSMLEELPTPTHTIDGMLIVPPKELLEGVDDIEEVALEGMSESIARSILDKLTTLMDSDELNIQDLKDITSMYKDVSAYLLKARGAKPSSNESGLGSFLSRLKA